MCLFVYSITYAVNLLTSEERESYENIYRSTHPSNNHVCIAINGICLKNRWSVMSLFNIMQTGTSFDSWLTNDNAQFQDNDKIDSRITDLMMPGQKYDYRTFENFLEAIEDASLEEAQTIEQALADPVVNLEQFGRFIKCLIIEKMEKNARFQATDEENNGQL